MYRLIARDGFELYYNGVRVAEDFVPGTLQRTGDKKAIIFACETEEDERILMIYDGVELKEIGAYVFTSKVVIFSLSCASSSKVLFIKCIASTSSPVTFISRHLVSLAIL